MKKLFTTLLLLIFGLYSTAQTYSYELKMDNFEQVNETEFQFDMHIKRGPGSDPFALYTLQLRWTHNPAIVNGGSFQTNNLTFVGGALPTGSELFQFVGWFNNNHFTRIDDSQLSWATVNAPATGDEVTVIQSDWMKIARLSVKLRNIANTAFHNFADLDPQFAFQLSGANILVRGCNFDGGNPGATMSGTANFSIPRAANGLIPALGVPVNATELAGYYMNTGTDWATAANWNNTVANTHPAYRKLPGVTNNALVGVNSVIATSTRAVIKNLYFRLSGSLRIKSDATGTGYLIHNNANVPATVERFLSQGKYHYVSSPVEAAPYSLFQVWPAPPSPAFADFYEWVETTRFWINLNYNLPVGVLAPGKGYAVAYSDADYTKEFVGELNVGTVSIPATYTPGESSPFWNQRGFNLVGNPYAAALDANALLAAHPNIYGLYFWDEAADYLGDRDDYATYSPLGGTSAGGNNSYVPDGKIAPMQGFIAQLKSTPFSQEVTIPVVFDNSMRTTDDSYFFKDQTDRDRIWLSVTGPQEDYNEILVGFMEGAEVGLDKTDAEKFKVTTRLAFYSELEGGDFVIQGLPVLNQTDTYEIALGVDAGFAGNYTFDVRMIENFDPAAVITLEDRLANKFTNLRTTSQYVAQIAEPGEIRNRFFLHFNGATSVPVIDQKLTKVYALQNQIIIQHLGNSEILDVEVINTLGQLVVRTPVNATETVVTVPGHNVVYIVKVRTTEGIESHKLLIR